MSEATVRKATRDDHEDVRAFTEDTWADRSVGDYVPEVFPQWVDADGEDQRTVVADVDGSAVGVCQATVLSPWEGWLQGMRVHPDHRGAGIGAAMVETLFEWCHDRGIRTARNMVFSWNGAGMGNSRATGFDPAIEARWAEPIPDAGADPSLTPVEDPDAAWAHYHGSDAYDRLGGLWTDPGESWSLSAATRERLAGLEDGRPLALQDDAGTRASTARVRVEERDTKDGSERTAVYGFSAWEDPAAAAALLSAIAADAASVDADATRVLIPETARSVSDVAAARVPISDEPIFVFAADLTGR
ncbi:GNAT family N-acetyltransferase [Halapricum sp. CBA1109]|uniref:GNAT family N-acetyltransferase n=1 Tax=Halapricum sp. CBA1109 TaxID=2668068 RepID=UPI0012F83346|nr:GNAT family N-acetyltransferase [Halapricum sp. CBA1109]MUV90504.1 GNAT family N-acetyltransferase [Halapricum sp. CBA1109]